MEYLLLDPLQARNELMQSIHLVRLRMGPCSLKKVVRTLKLHRQRLLVVALDNHRVVGFKLGFGERAEVFHSWMGAVAAEYEGQGLGRRLMEIQHQKLQEWGYHKVRTGTRNRFLRMLILNLKSGFSIVGLKVKGREPHIQLEKTFARNFERALEPASL